MFERIAPSRHDTIEGVASPAETVRLFGHEEVRRSLAGDYRSGKLHHALLLTGPEGIGKATFAFHLANHLLAWPDPALAPEMIGDPEPSSQIFRGIAQGAHPSVLHLTRPPREGSAKGFKTVLTVDEIRKVNRFLSMSSHDGSYRVVIVDPADDMNTSAANALLKNLEEPPRRTVFVLIAHQPGRLLPTIRSRCRVVRMKPLEEPDLAGALAAAGAELPPEGEGRSLLMARSAGSVRAALMLTQYGGLEIAAAMDEILAGKAFDYAAATKLSEATTHRDQPEQFDLFAEHLLDMLSSRAAAAASAGELASASRLEAIWNQVRAGLDELRTYNLDKRHFAMMTLSEVHAGLAA